MLMETEVFQWLGIDYLISPGRRIFLGYLLLAFFIAAVVTRLTGQSRSSWLGRNIWWHASARLDYRYFVLSAMIKFSLITPLLWNAGDVASYLLWWSDQIFGYRSKLVPVSQAVVISYGLCLFLANDLSRYWLHRWMHRCDSLWSIHKVHHSAEVLTPFTFYRVHPVENILFGFRYALTAGSVSALFLYCFGSRLGLTHIAGVNVFVIIFHILGDNLRHSHVHFRYPGWLEKILVSPAQHQLHHSCHGSQYNYGGVLAIWDFCFGSLKQSASKPDTNFGISNEIAPNSITGLLLLPFSSSYQMKPLSVSMLLMLILGWAPGISAGETESKASLGRVLFFDKNLSLNRNQSCATCHSPEQGFSEPRDSNVGAAASLGDDLISLGDRNTPSLGYVSLSPDFHYDQSQKLYKGGFFWDGRAPDLQSQAGQPILNPIEMAMPDVQAVVNRVLEKEHYRITLQNIYGAHILSEPAQIFAAISDSLAEFERSNFFNPFDSKYDRYLRGDYELSDEEDLGMSLFFSTTNSNCSSCHQLKVMDDEGEPFSNYEYHNIGTPVNQQLRARNDIPEGYQDAGLGSENATGEPDQRGKFKVPGLRNVAVTGPYMHNGVFRELRTVIEFYDQYNNPGRVNNPETGKPWKVPEIKNTVSRKELKAKRLNDSKIDALVAFLKTLTDQRYQHLID